MKSEEATRIEAALREVPAGTVERRPSDTAAFGRAMQARTTGRGKMEQITVFPGVEAAFDTFLGEGVAFHHSALSSALEIFHCRSGRVGWNMREGTSVYLGRGDVSIHGMDLCASSEMIFPLGYAEGVSISAGTCLPDVSYSAPVGSAGIPREGFV